MLTKLIVLFLCVSALMGMRLRQVPATVTPPPTPTNATEVEYHAMLLISKNSSVGDFIVDDENLTVYMFARDQIGNGFTEKDFNITCYDACADNWPPVTLLSQDETWTAGQGLQQNLIGKRQRNETDWQLTYNNVPLYYYIGDEAPGDINGQKLNADGGLWWLLNPQGQPIK